MFSKGPFEAQLTINSLSPGLFSFFLLLYSPNKCWCCGPVRLTSRSFGEQKQSDNAGLKFKPSQSKAPASLLTSYCELSERCSQERRGSHRLQEELETSALELMFLYLNTKSHPSLMSSDTGRCCSSRSLNNHLSHPWWVCKRWVLLGVLSKSKFLEPICGLPSPCEVKGHARDGVRAAKLENQASSVEVPDSDDLWSFGVN